MSNIRKDVSVEVRRYQDVVDSDKYHITSVALSWL